MTEYTSLVPLQPPKPVSAQRYFLMNAATVFSRTRRNRNNTAGERTSMAMKLYDLAGAQPDRRFSPFCWRTTMALAHKGLEAESIPWRFSEKALLAPYNWERVPVLVDNGRGVVDSWTIANYLEDTYRERPSLFGGPAGRALSRFYNQWTDTVLLGAVARIILLDVFSRIDERDRPYFRANREQRFGMTLEAFCADRESRLPALRQLLEPLRQTLAAQPFIGGDAPLYPDYIVFGAFQFARAMSPFALLEVADLVNVWRERLLDAHGGIARRAPGYW
jgi:glutathione S-transferase